MSAARWRGAASGGPAAQPARASKDERLLGVICELRRLDELLGGDALLAPIAARWEQASRDRGRPTIAMSLFVRLMVLKQRTGWGYETLVREVSDSLHMRRFCGLSLAASVPHESTIRKLARRLGCEVIDEITRLLIGTAVREKRFVPRAMRVDSTVVEANVRWPSDAALAHDATRLLAREGASTEPAVSYWSCAVLHAGEQGFDVNFGATRKDEHRAACSRRHPARDAAQHDSVRGSVGARSHDEQIYALRGGLEPVGWVLEEDVRLDLDVRRELGDRLLEGSLGLHAVAGIAVLGGVLVTVCARHQAG